MDQEIIVAPKALLPLPKLEINVRPAVAADLPFVDRLQKLHNKALGFLQAGALEGKLRAGEVLVAEDASGPAGYCIASDRYFKRDDVGIIYHMNVAPGRQRGLVGATLLQAQFERSAWGCKLYCCWCAQDLVGANRFWEAMGFAPLALRAGGRGKGGRPRVHLFWQKRIRKGDVATPWWFPSKTDGGAMRADRIVLPIPPGTLWSEATLPALPGFEVAALPGPRRVAAKKVRIVERPLEVRRNGLRFDVPRVEAASAVVVAEKKAPRAKVKCDPRLVAAARELRDRWLEHVNAGGAEVGAAGKYEVARLVDAGTPRLAFAA